MNTILFDARLHSARLAAVVRLSPTARLQRKSTVCGLSGLRPVLQTSHASPPIKSSPRLDKLAALAPESLCAVSTGELPFPVWKEKLQCTPIFLSNSGIEGFLERIRGSKRLAQPKRRRPVNTKTELPTSHITMNINGIIITGNLVANPTLRNTESGTPVASATIANNEFYNDGEGERQQVTTFVDVTVWGKPAENFSTLAKKGQEVILEGQLRRNDWESEDGQKHSKHFVRAETWQFTQYKKD